MSNQNTAVATAPKENKVAAIPRSVKAWVNSDYFKSQVALVLPKHLTPERFVRVAISAITRIPKLADCTPESVMACMMTCSELGIEPDGRRAHLIPFGKVCTLIVDYKGLVELAKRSGDVSNIHAQVVCENDVFEYDTGEITHKIDFRRERGDMYAVYCIINFKDGGKHAEVMTRGEVDRIRQRSRAGNNGPWVTDYQEMSKKTVFRRASKWITLSPEIRDALDKDADAMPGANTLVNEMPMALPEPEAGTIEVGGEPEPRAEDAEPQQKTAETKPEIGTVQDTLSEIVTGAGFTFADFQKWAGGSGNIADADSLPDFIAVPTEVARRLTRAKAGLLKGLAETKGPQPA
jgi:recombination protein RecT